MNVYVETNFVLELALQRDQWIACQDILKLNQTGQCHVYVPALALVEPHSAIFGMRRSRERVSAELSTQLRELARREPNRSLPETTFKPLSDAFALAASQEDEGIAQVAAQILGEAGILPLDAHTLLLSQQYRDAFRLEIPDAIMLASAILHTQQSEGSGIFLNRNHRDFDVPEIKALLSSHNCSFCRNFAEGAQIIRDSHS